MRSGRTPEIINVCFDNIDGIEYLIASMLDDLAWKGNYKVVDTIKAGSYDLYYGGRYYSLVFDRDVKYHGVIDMKADSSVNVEGIQLLLSKVKKEGVLGPGLKFVAEKKNDVEVWYLYSLKNTLLAHKKTDEILYCDVLDVAYENTVGSGSYGSVYAVAGTIKPRFFNSKDLWFSPGNGKRVSKVSTFRKSSKSYNKSLQRFRREADLLKRSQHSSVRDLHEKTSADAVDGFISLRRFNGNDLEDSIAYDRATLKLEKKAKELRESYYWLVNKSGKFDPRFTDEYLNRLDSYGRSFHNLRRLLSKLKPELTHEMTVLDRIELSIRLLREFNEEIVKNKIIHADIKSENIFIDLSKYYREAKPRFIDFGLSRDESDSEPGRIGTPLYLAPEAVSGVGGRAADVYALVRVIGEIWRDKELKSYEKKSDPVSSFFRARQEEHFIQYDMFDGIKIPQELKDLIEKAIRGGTAFEIRDRYNAEKLIEQFEVIRLKYYLLIADEQIKTSIYYAHHFALLTRAAFSDKSKFSIDSFIAFIEKELIEISDHPLVLEIYTRTLDIDSLKTCSSKQGIIDELRQVKLRYDDAVSLTLSRIELMKSSATESGNESYIKYMSYQYEWMKKFMSEARNVNDMYPAINKLYEKIYKLDAAKDYYIKSKDQNNNFAMKPRQ